MRSEKQLREPLIEAGIDYSLAALLPLLLSLLAVSLLQAALGEGYLETLAYRYVSFLLPQICLAAAAAVFFGRRSLPIKKVYAPCKWYYYPVAVCLAFGLLFFLSGLNDYFIDLLRLIGYTPQAEQEGYLAPVTADMVSGFYLIPTLLIIAVLPAVFEETTFRGIQLGAMKAAGWGTLPAVLITGALFSLFHGNPEQTVYQFVCGACFALLVVRSGSLYPSMLAHFLNNGVILVLAAFLGVEWSLPQTASVVLTALGAAAFVASLVFLLCDRTNRMRGKPQGGRKYFLAAGVGILACALEWALVLVMGCLA